MSEDIREEEKKKADQYYKIVCENKMGDNIIIVEIRDGLVELQHHTNAEIKIQSKRKGAKRKTTIIDTKKDKQ